MTPVPALGTVVPIVDRAPMAPSARHIVEWLDRSAREHAERIAIEDSAGGAIDYREQGRLSRRVQTRLAAAGVRSGDRVGVFMKKSIDTLIAFQAILRSGAAYVPADPLAPARRAASMFSDCGASAVFVDEPLADDLRRELGVCDASPTMIVVPASPHESHTWRIEAVAAGEESPPIMRSPDNMAFLLYTSGSTGAPKAVVLTDRNVVSFVDWCSEAFAVHASDKFATHAPLQFSLVVFHLYVAWKHGAAVVLIDEQTAKTPALLAPLIEQRGITIWFSAPTILGLLAQSGELASRVYPSLRLVMFGGTPFPQSHFRQLRAELPRPRYLHIFGSTETHIMARFEIPPELPADTAAAIPIGEISSHFRSRIIGEDGNDVPSGVDGELCLCGPGVTPGYWKTPADRALAFFTDAAGDRWYRTGDIVVAQASGCLIHRGRRDRMIKKRGYRVELAEIETCLHENLAVKEAAVVAVTDEELGMRVHAFVVAQSGTRPTIIGLKAHCVGSLPAYMVPDVFAFVEALPRTSSGKIDFPALRERSESHKE